MSPVGDYSDKEWKRYKKLRQRNPDRAYYERETSLWGALWRILLGGWRVPARKPPRLFR